MSRCLQHTMTQGGSIEFFFTLKFLDTILSEAEVPYPFVKLFGHCNDTATLIYEAAWVTG